MEDSFSGWTVKKPVRYHCIISGAGSTLMAYADPAQDGAAIGQAMV
jgi:homoserine kinase